MDGFWQNVSRYPRYFITTLLGVFFALYEWLKPLFSRPASAIAFVLFLVSGFAFLYFTLEAMLGLSPAS